MVMNIIIKKLLGNWIPNLILSILLVFASIFMYKQVKGVNHIEEFCEDKDHLGLKGVGFTEINDQSVFGIVCKDITGVKNYVFIESNTNININSAQVFEL